VALTPYGRQVARGDTSISLARATRVYLSDAEDGSFVSLRGGGKDPREGAADGLATAAAPVSTDKVDFKDILLILSIYRLCADAGQMGGARGTSHAPFVAGAAGNYGVFDLQHLQSEDRREETNDDFFRRSGWPADKEEALELGVQAGKLAQKLEEIKETARARATTQSKTIDRSGVPAAK
jgi:hypothetical protein